MSPRKFDRFMVQVGIGTNRKLRRLPIPQRWAYVAGVLSLAAQSPMRGSLLIHDGEHVTAEDIAAEATISVKDARAAMTSFRRMGMLERDADGVEWVHDWDDLNPEPRPSDAPEQTRERKRRERARKRGSHADVTTNGHADVTRDTPPVSRDEVEGEVEDPPSPQGGDETGKVVRFARRPVPTGRLSMAERLLAYFNEQAKTSYGSYTGRDKPSPNLQRIIGALTDHPQVDEDQWQRAIRWRLANPFWDGKPHAGVVFGPGAVEGNLMSAMQTGVDAADVHRKLLGADA